MATCLLYGGASAAWLSSAGTLAGGSPANSRSPVGCSISVSRKLNGALCRLPVGRSCHGLKGAIKSGTGLQRFDKSFELKRKSTNTGGSAYCAVSEEVVVDAVPVDTRVPVTVITGFLGSGKTTLLNHILTAEHGKRIAVIENEYGEVDIDGGLVASKQKMDEDIVMLNNGCLCCTVRGDLVRMLYELVQTKKDKFDHILIETTGLANPAPVIQTFFLEDLLSESVRLDGVVTVVDAKHVGIHMDSVKPEGVVNEAVEQIAFADRIILNKTDLVSEKELTSTRNRIRRINALAQLQHATFSKVDMDYVLGIGGFDLERIDKEVREELLTDSTKAEAHSHDHSHEHSHEHEHEHEHEHDHTCAPDCGHDHSHDHAHDHVHDPGVSSVSIVCDGELDLERINDWLGLMLEERQDDIYRMKGVLAIKGSRERFVFQGVHALFEGSPDRKWSKDEKRSNKIVFIGKNLDREEIQSGFESCLVKK